MPTHPFPSLPSLPLPRTRIPQAGDRKKAQIEQSVNWWAEQTAIRDALRAAEKEAETAHAELVKYQDLLQQTAKSEEAAVRREVARATADYNKRLAEEKRLREYAAKQADLAANMAEMEATITSSFMTEVRGRKAHGANRRRGRGGEAGAGAEDGGWEWRSKNRFGGTSVACYGMHGRVVRRNEIRGGGRGSRGWAGGSRAGALQASTGSDVGD